MNESCHFPLLPQEGREGESVCYWHSHYCMFTYIYYLLIKKGICDRQNISSSHVFLFVGDFHLDLSSFLGKSFPFLFIFSVL